MAVPRLFIKMEYFCFGERELSRLALGTWPMDNRDWGGADDDVSMRTIQHALEVGINVIDTAPVYGPEHAEVVVGRALEGRRGEVFLASKCGIRWTDVRLYQDLSYASVKQECEHSLRRLRTDVIDLMQVHWPHAESPLEETMRALNELRDEGKIRHIGVSNFSVELMDHARQLARIETVQPPYHLFFRGAERDVLPYCQEHGIATLAYGPLCKGMLTGKFNDGRAVPDDIRRKDPFFGDEVFPELLAVVRRLSEIAEAAGITTAQLALAYTLTRPGLSCAIVGARNPQQLDETARAGSITLADDVRDAVAACVASAPFVV